MSDEDKQLYCDMRSECLFGYQNALFLRKGQKVLPAKTKAAKRVKTTEAIQPIKYLDYVLKSLYI